MDLNHSERQKFLANLPGAKLNSLLLESFAERAQGQTPASVLHAWENDRFVKLGPLSPRDLLQFDLIAYDAAHAFQPVELSPLCPFGTNTSVAPMSQKKVLSTIRSSEVVADSTNVMALECSLQRKKLLKENPKDNRVVRLCSSHRLVRVQKFDSPGAMAHFRVFGLCSAGRDSGGYEFEAAAMSEHIKVFYDIFQRLRSRGTVIRDVNLGLYGEDDVLRVHVTAALQKTVPSFKIENLGTRKSSYYPSTSFKIWATNHHGTPFELADGGITDWTQKFVESSKERLMISGLGTDRIVQNFVLAK